MDLFVKHWRTIKTMTDIQKKQLRLVLEFLRGALIIFIFLQLGNLASAYSPIAFPGSIIGLLLLFSALVFNLIKLEWVLVTANFALKYMVLLFIPIGVGLINYFDLVQQHWQVIIASLFFTTFSIMFIVGHLFQYLNRHQRIKSKKD